MNRSAIARYFHGVAKTSEAETVPALHAVDLGW